VLVSRCRGVKVYGPFSDGSFGLVNLCCIRGQRLGKRGFKTGSNIITDILNIGPEQPVGDFFKNRFSEAKGNFEDKIKKMTAFGLRLKRKRKLEKSQSMSKRRKVNDIFGEQEKREVMQCLKSGLDIFLKRSIQTSIVNSHTVT